MSFTMFLRVSYLEISKDNDTRTVVQVSDVARGPFVFNFIIGFVFSTTTNLSPMFL